MQNTVLKSIKRLHGYLYHGKELPSMGDLSEIAEAARRYGDMCKPVDVEALRSFIESVIAYWTTSNECLPSQKDAERLLADISGFNASMSHADPADAQGGGADICTTNNVEELFRALDDFCSTKADEECMAFLKAKLRQLLKERGCDGY